MMAFKREPTISVGILSGKYVNFELYGDFKVEGFKQTFRGIFFATVAENKIICKGGKDKFEITNEIIFEPQDSISDSFLIRDVTIGVRFHWERKEKQRFLGSLKLLREKDKIWVINIIPIEQYLASVISSEMNAKSSVELLKAHAIISRSWFFAQSEKSKSQKKKIEKPSPALQSEVEIIKWQGREDHKLFDVCADDHCQRYQGITKVSTEAVAKAIEQTYGLILTSENKICDTRYSKSCGGITEAFENVWEPVKHKYLVSVIDYKYDPENYDIDFSYELNARKWILGNSPAFCSSPDEKILPQVLPEFDQETKDFYRWKVDYTQSELSKIIREKTGIDFGDIKDLVPLERGKSARLIKLKIEGSKKSMVIGKELEIRRALSYTHLYSSAITIEKSEEINGVPQKFTLHGAGWGHGVGLCQIGAAVMAAQGYMFDEILFHYFKDVRLKKVY
jgi:SpoIID/LytB domain protein